MGATCSTCRWFKAYQTKDPGPYVPRKRRFLCFEWETQEGESSAALLKAKGGA